MFDGVPGFWEQVRKNKKIITDQLKSIRTISGAITPLAML
jgi:hypothetical protein